MLASRLRVYRLRGQGPAGRHRDEDAGQDVAGLEQRSDKPARGPAARFALPPDGSRPPPIAVRGIDRECPRPGFKETRE